MAGFIILTNLPPDKSYRVALRAAEDLQYAVQPRGQGAFSAGKGSMALSIFVGAFVAYCDFQIFVEDLGEDVEIRIQRNSPWWTGFIGVNRVKNKARELTNAIADGIEGAGGKVRKEREY